MSTRIPGMTLAIAFLTLQATLATAAESPRPNILLILCDDLGYADVGFNGSTDIRTPELDRLAKAGTVFSSAYVVHPFCGPSRAGLLSGRYPHSIGAQFNLPDNGPDTGRGIPVSETLISTVLQDAGYFTGLVGKWHLGFSPQFHPNQRGFDDFYGFLNGGHEYFPSHYRPIYERQRMRGTENIRRYIRPLEHNGTEMRETEYITDVLSREAVRFVHDAASKTEPFFLYLAYNAPHTPLQAKEEDMAEFPKIDDPKRRTYAGMVYAVDRGVGEIVKALKATGQFDDTLIVFLSDNGGKLGAGANNRPLRGGKGNTYEGGYRVPMLFHWPGNVPQGQRFTHPVSALDFYPTFAGLGNAKIPADKQLAGKDIWKAFKKGQDPRQGDFIFTLRHRLGENEVGVRQDQWKLYRFGKTPWKLFNLDDDINEANDLSVQYPERVKSMVEAAEKWSQSHQEPRWFDSASVAKNWASEDMPQFEATFQSK
ncbi:MAG: sulfatase family protein [Rubripirellula sp.]